MVASSITNVRTFGMRGICFAYIRIARIRFPLTKSGMPRSPGTHCAVYRFATRTGVNYVGATIVCTAVFLHRLCLFLQTLGRIQFRVT